MLDKVKQLEDNGEYGKAFGVYMVELAKRLPPKEVRRKEEQFVYFIECGNRMKIGVSVCPQDRVKQLQTGSPSPLVLRAAVSGGHNVEKELHHKFSDERLDGEWFLLSQRLEKYIEEIKNERC